MKRRKQSLLEEIFLDFNMVLLIIVAIIVGIFFNNQAFASEVKVIRLDDESVAQIRVTPRGTALSFPVKPDHVVLGQNRSFGLEYIKNDVIVSPLKAGARSNLFIYLMGRRYTFDLVATAQGGYTIIVVKDKPENLMRVKP